MICSTDQLLIETAFRWPTKDAIVASDEGFTYEQLAKCSRALASLVSANGIRAGDRVVVCMQRSFAEVACMFAIWALRAVVVNANPKLMPWQVDYIVADSNASLVLADASWLEKAVKNAASHVDKTCVVSFAPHGETTLTGASGMRESSRDYEFSIESNPVRRALAMLIYTSGSSGQPKGVMVSHGNLIAGTECVVDYVGIHHDDRIISLLPFSFDYGLNQLLCSVSQGATLTICRFIFPQEIEQAIRKYDITVVAGVPGIWSGLFRAKNRGTGANTFETVRRVTNSGGAVSRKIVDRIQQGFPEAKVFLMYGLTEAFRSTFLEPNLMNTHGDSIGRAVPNAQVFLVDEKGERVPFGGIGEIVHRGDTVALGYWNRPEETRATFRPYNFVEGDRSVVEQVVFSGDLARADGNGYLYYLGRRDAQIKVSGFRLNPAAVEQVISEIPAVTEVVITAAKGKDDGDDVMAAFLIGDDELDEERVLRHLHRRLPAYMIPSRLFIRTDLPRLASGKPDRIQLKDEWQQERERDFDAAEGNDLQ